MSVLTMEFDDFLKTLSDLEYLVISLDRIGSDNQSPGDRQIALERFVVEGDVFARLTSMRRMLLDLMNGQLSSAEQARIERKIAQVNPWGVD